LLLHADTVFRAGSTVFFIGESRVQRTAFLKKIQRQYRTKIVRQMRRQIFRQMKQKAE
jgi:GH24 family phage-related lysozyme (muramidase)